MWPLRKLFEYTSSFSFLKRKKTKTLKKDNILEMSHQKQNEMYITLQSKRKVSAPGSLQYRRQECVLRRKKMGRNISFGGILDIE